jgi:GH24 family phage-related lysozyme (muramidase)
MAGSCRIYGIQTTKKIKKKRKQENIKSNNRSREWVSLKTQQVAGTVSLFFSIGHCFYDKTPKTRLVQQT